MATSSKPTPMSMFKATSASIPTIGSGKIMTNNLSVCFMAFAGGII